MSVISEEKFSNDVFSVHVCRMFVPQAARGSFGSSHATFTGTRVTTGRDHSEAAGRAFLKATERERRTDPENTQ